jgi:antirestriction protein ArdC
MNKAEFSNILTEIVARPGIISEAYSRFHGYSFGNVFWAYIQCEARNIEMGPLATFKKWKELGRNVKKGEKALSLVMPVTIAKKDELGEKTGEVFSTFMVKNNWFALSQTEGAEFKPEPSSTAWDAAKAMSALGITEEPFAAISGNVQGYAKQNTIAINPVAALPHKTRIHEIAHIVLGHTTESTMTDSEHTPRDVREVEAESVAYILCKLLNLPGLEESRGYVQSWLDGEKITEKSAAKIFAAAHKIMQAGQ